MALPATQAKMPSAPPTSTVGMMARPSRPSVRFTALLVPTITTKTKGMNSQPRGISTSLKYGMSSAVDWGESARRYRITPTPMATSDCQKSFSRADSPLGLRRISLR